MIKVVVDEETDRELKLFIIYCQDEVCQLDNTLILYVMMDNVPTDGLIDEVTQHVSTLLTTRTPKEWLGDILQGGFINPHYIKPLTTHLRDKYKGAIITCANNTAPYVLDEI